MTHRRPETLVRRAILGGWPLVVLVPAIALMAWWWLPSPSPVTYQARLSLALDVPPELVIPGSDASAAKVGETLIDDISRVIGGDRFAAAVAERLDPDVAVRAGEIAASLSATDRHRVTDITVTRSVPAAAPTQEHLAARAELASIAEAVVTELSNEGGDWFGLLGAGQVALTVVDGPDVQTAGPGLRERLELPLRLAAAGLAGVGLALLSAALDPRVWDRHEAETAAGAPTLGVLPDSPPAP